MKLYSAVPLTLIVFSIFVIVCSGSPVKNEEPVSAACARKSLTWQGEQWSLKSLLRAAVNSNGADDEDVDRDKWPKLELNWKLVVGSVVGFIGSALGSAGGVGGGAYYLTMLNLFIGFDAKISTALSKSMVMGAAVAATLFNLNEKHPHDDRLPVLDYSMALLFQPLLLLGISIGVLFNVLLPQWLITVLFCIVIGDISRKGIKKANKLSLQEKTLLLKSSQGSDHGDYIAVPSEVESIIENGAGVIITPKAGYVILWGKLGILLVTWSIFCLLQVSKLYVPTCSAWYWTLDILQIPIAVGVTVYEALDCRRKEQIKHHDVHSDTEETHAPEAGIWKNIKSSAYGLAAGFIGGLLGVGGGGIMGPAFLELGLPPQVASATASFNMVFSSSLSVVEYWLLGRLPAAFAVYCISLAALSSIFGQLWIKRLVGATGKASYIVYCLAYSILFSGVVLAGFGAVNNYRTWRSGGYMGFHSICSAH
ncbi:hypothetical protein R1flu_015187 [Riccia fluitans]|uniref:Sulfite exporter TauE/SafE family protein n=1 Tax=Riccia fluitans TaxID=41844 RepID=A0ABD1YIN7_9MARC